MYIIQAVKTISRNWGDAFGCGNENLEQATERLSKWRETWPDAKLRLVARNRGCR